jgi:hypothetical protein
MTKPHDLSLGMRHQNASWRWFVGETVFDRGEQGRVSPVLGIATDVTAFEADRASTRAIRELAGRVRVLEGILDRAGEGIAGTKRRDRHPREGRPLRDEQGNPRGGIITPTASGDDVLAHGGKSLASHVRCTELAGRYGG